MPRPSSYVTSLPGFLSAINILCINQAFFSNSLSRTMYEFACAELLKTARRSFFSRSYIMKPPALPRNDNFRPSLEKSPSSLALPSGRGCFLPVVSTSSKLPFTVMAAITRPSGLARQSVTAPTFSIARDEPPARSSSCSCPPFVSECSPVI